MTVGIFKDFSFLNYFQKETECEKPELSGSVKKKERPPPPDLSKVHAAVKPAKIDEKKSKVFILRNYVTLTSNFNNKLFVAVHHTKIIKIITWV